MTADDDVADFLDAADEMATAGRLVLARLLAEEAAARVGDDTEAARILALYPAHNLDQEA
ncbi:hypothetical protein GCM10023347_05210 [Streptomyces chumphonensis]|uniref:Uncharacterized protein n=1 Tax=Streptomyces chumphonensis TaxID=1214925 RepID=A0A927IEA7_9ACTN|nr:hypothetical protein [Streptomyces chumphonensis]MBD3933151.1 hypothetical protein [Streptomyces chumphonensis]